MTGVLVLLAKVAGIAVLLLVIACAIALPFIARGMLKQLRARQREADAFATDIHKRMAEMRARSPR